MIRRIGHHFEAFFRAVMPDPFVLAIGLTLLTFGLAFAIEGATPVAILDAWQGPRGFWSLLKFGMQMVFMLITGHALASTPAVSGAIRRVASLPGSGAQAAAMVAALSIFAALLNWGLGLIVGALLAREVGASCHRRGVRAHYPLLAASGFMGLSTWHGGLSGSAPLKVTTRADLVEMLGAEAAASMEPMPFTDTVFSSANALITGGLWVLIPLLCAALAPRDNEPVAAIDAFSPGDPFEPDDSPPETGPDKLERAAWVVWLLALPLAATLYFWAARQGIGTLNPNILNIAFLMLGLLLHGSVRRYQQALVDGISGTTGIVLQFPFYAGIMGVMHGTGLATRLSSLVAEAAGPKGFGIATFLSAGLVNVFVPSGGGQWAVQGPIALSAAAELGASPELAVLSVAYGDQWTNLLQPFWALPLLGITGVSARDIVGYTAVVLLASGAWVMGCLWVLF